MFSQRSKGRSSRNGKDLYPTKLWHCVLEGFSTHLGLNCLDGLVPDAASPPAAALLSPSAASSPRTRLHTPPAAVSGES